MRLNFSSLAIAAFCASKVAAKPDSISNGQPIEYRSKDGRLDVTLTVDLLSTPELNRTAPAYDGLPVGPTLRAKPGDKVRIKLINKLAPSSAETLELSTFAMTPFTDGAEQVNQTLVVNRLQYPTGNYQSIPEEEYWGKAYQNLHFHGLMVDPFIDDGRVYVDGGGSLIYEWLIPKNSPRLFGFYHNHVHGTSAYSSLSGLYGAFVIENPETDQVTADIATTPQVSEHFLLLSESKTNADGTAANFISMFMDFDWEHVTNGQVDPTFYYKKGQMVHFRAVNAGVEPPMILSIENHTMIAYANDGHPIPKPQVSEQVIIDAGSRSEFLVKFDTPGSFKFLRAPWKPFDNICEVYGIPFDPCVSFDRELTVANIVVLDEGIEVDDSIALWDPLSADVETSISPNEGGEMMDSYLKQLLSLPKAPESRTITFDQEEGFPIFQIPYDGPPEGPGVGFAVNDLLFNPHYFHGDIKGGTCEDWTIVYDPVPFHTVHTHSVPYYVTSIDGVELQETERFWRDTFASAANFTATVCFPPRTTESYINVHCHMPNHQDAGMAAFYRLLPGGEIIEDGTAAGNDGDVVTSESSDGRMMMTNSQVGVVALAAAVVFLIVV